jgi:hypothetical protein
MTEAKDLASVVLTHCAPAVEKNHWTQMSVHAIDSARSTGEPLYARHSLSRATLHQA